jgi:hypothetical protein
MYKVAVSHARMIVYHDRRTESRRRSSVPHYATHWGGAPVCIQAALPEPRNDRTAATPAPCDDPYATGCRAE